MQLKKQFTNISLTTYLELLDSYQLVWFIKRLSGNDTGLTGGHQAGLYIPRAFFEKALPEINVHNQFNPRSTIKECYFPAEDQTVSNLQAIYYNSKYFPERGLHKKYDEFRLTGWGGQASPVQNVENTGSICIFAILNTGSEVSSIAWIADNLAEENIVENWLGCEIEPGRTYVKSHHEQVNLKISNNIPPEWFIDFPSGKDIFEFTVRQIPKKTWNKSLDQLLLKRRELEFQLFETIEQAHILPNIKNGFDSVDDFIRQAHSISNRRKSRTGRSLELNLESIFNDAGLIFETQVITENKKKPDFLFPTAKAYQSQQFPNKFLYMMAAKTCC